MATASVAFKSSEDHRKQQELEEVRKAGLAPAEVDENGKEINPYIPKYISSAPWYLNSKRSSLEHQRISKVEPSNLTNSRHGRGAKTISADNYKPVACEKRNKRSEAKDEARRNLLKEQKLKKLEVKDCNQFGGDNEDALKVDEAKVDESKQMDFAKVAKRVRTTVGGFSGTVWNLRIREDRAKYLLNLDTNSGHYDPKRQSMCEDPLADTDPNEKLYLGDNSDRVSGEALEFKHALEAFEKGHNTRMLAAPTQAKMLYENWQIDKEKLNSQMKHNVLEKCGNAASDEELPKVLLLG